MGTETNGESEDKSKFRMNAKSFWLTYSALYRGELDHKRILSMLMSKGTLVEYSIGCEHHKEETVADPNRDEHFHVYVAYENKKNIKSPRFFDMRGDGTYGSRNLHCNIDINRTKKDRLNRINYTMKEDPTPFRNSTDRSEQPCQRSRSITPSTIENKYAALLRACSL